MLWRSRLPANYQINPCCLNQFFISIVLLIYSYRYFVMDSWGFHIWLYEELMYSTTSIISYFFACNQSYISFSTGTERSWHQFSVVFTWMEDRLFPILWNSGVMNKSVRLLHTNCTDGKSIMKLWITGITNLEGQGQKVTSEQMLRNDAFRMCSKSYERIMFVIYCFI